MFAGGVDVWAGVGTAVRAWVLRLETPLDGFCLDGHPSVVWDGWWDWLVGKECIGRTRVDTEVAAMAAYVSDT